MLEHVGEQAGFTRLGVGVDLDRRDRERLVARLDDRLHRVAELRDDVEAVQRISRVGAEARCGVGQLGPGCTVHHPRAKALHHLLESGEVLDGVGLAVANDDVSAAGKDRRNEVGDARLRVLVVTIGVDDDVGAMSESKVHPVTERPCETHAGGVRDHVMDPELTCDLDRAVS